MTAKSVLLNTVIVFKTSSVGPLHNQKMLKCVPFIVRVQPLCAGNLIENGISAAVYVAVNCLWLGKAELK